MKMKREVIILTAGAVLGLYIGSYAFLSSHGQYVPGAWGLGWVKLYIWAPHGFVSGPTGTENNRFLQAAYFPLWQIDWRLIHTPDKASERKHPINTMLDDALQKRLHQREQNQASQTIGAKAPQPER
jgi:hypothetical protein